MIEIPRVGQVIEGKYRLDEVIGEGGFAIVYRATDTTVDRAVALKVLVPGQNGYALTVASRFAREAKILANLTDGHTIRLFHFGRTGDGILFMVFELLSGVDLRTYLNNHGCLCEAVVVRVMRQVLASLREAHAAGILHRDIKPSNVHIYEYLDDPLRVKLLDFGIARPLGNESAALTAAGQVVGTPRYMSPEQAVGAELTPTSDLFSLALVALEMLTGDPRAPLVALVTGRPIDIPASPHLRWVLEGMLARDPDQRFRSAAHVLDALDDAPRHNNRAGASDAAIQRQQLSTSERRAGHTEASPHLSHRLVAVGGVALAVVVAGFAVVATYKESHDEEASLRLNNALMAPQRVLNQEPVKPAALVEPATAVEPADVAVPDPPDADISTVAGGGCGDAQHPSSGPMSTGSRGETVSWTLHVPRSYDSHSPHPLLVVFHGTGGTPGDLLNDSGLNDFADEHGIVVVAPHAETTVWSFEHSDPDSFLALVEQTKRELCIDDARIYVLGHDTGGMMAERLTCHDWVTGVVSTSYRPRDLDLPCKSPPKPRLIMTPRQSRHVPIEGGVQCLGRTMHPLSGYEKLWRERNRCRGAPETWLREGKTTCRRWSCDEPLASCEVSGGHNWPGMTPRQWDLLGCDGEPGSFDYMEAIWSFFTSIE